MMTSTETIDSGNPSDADLVTGSLDGNTEAFRQIVERYKNLVCSVAYCATGNVSQSEDLAQETFIAAWGNLRLLREPGKLRGWLCGIVRHRTQKQWGRAERQPTHNALSLAEAVDTAAPEALPSDQAVTRDEEAIMWRSLAKIPAIYREPLILFYREHQSITRVAEALELSEDAVKQRLSRGRRMLQEEVQAFIESALDRTAPKPAFSDGVLAVLPIMTAPVAATGWGAAVKSTGGLKVGMLAGWLVPFIGSLGGIAAHWLAIRVTTTDPQLRFRKIRQLITAWFVLLGGAVGGDFLVEELDRHFAWSARVGFTVTVIFWWVYACALITWVVALIRPYLDVFSQSETASTLSGPTRKQGNCVAMVVGVNVSLGSWLVYLAWLAHDWIAIGMIAGALVGLGTWQCCAVPQCTGLAAARASLGHTALAAAAVVLIFNLRVDQWVAFAHGVSVTEIRDSRPMWLIPVLTGAWLAWGGLVAAWMNCKRRTD